MKGAYATKGNQWVSYNDVQYVKEKADYVIKNKYGGVAVFTMDMDDFNNNCCQVRFIEIKWLYINSLQRHLQRLLLTLLVWAYFLYDAVFACLAWLLFSSERPNWVFVLEATIFQFVHRVRRISKANCKMGIGPLL